jgi:LEA14-like dessication related protein
LLERFTVSKDSNTEFNFPKVLFYLGQNFCKFFSAYQAKLPIIYIMGKCFFLLFLSILLFFAACKTPPPGVQGPPAAPLFAPVLEFERIEADSVDRVRLYYRLKAENPRSGPLDIAIQSRKVLLNGLELDSTAAVLTLDDIAALDARISIKPKSSAEKTLVLELDLAALPSALPDGFMSEDEYLAGLSLDLAYRYGGARAPSGAVSVETAFPRIREPAFTISSIAIQQAELINTRFQVSLRIDNPNPFPLVLSSFGYELYGDDRFWADGKEQNALHVPAQSSAETSLSLVMNFINMRRQLLDEIIAMRQVRYRFTGEAEVGTGVSWLPSFRASFDRSGHSAVLK